MNRTYGIGVRETSTSNRNLPARLVADVCSVGGFVSRKVNVTEAFSTALPAERTIPSMAKGISVGGPEGDREGDAANFTVGRAQASKHMLMRKPNNIFAMVELAAQFERIAPGSGP
jgi:hypothetical protein